MLPLLLVTAALQQAAVIVPDSGETHLRNIRQITFGGQNAEAYFSHSGRQLILQRTPGDSGCDQQYVVNTDGTGLHRVSSGLGRTTCGYFFAGDARIFYASTEHADTACPPRPDYSQGYVWALYDYDIYVADSSGRHKKRLTRNRGYDAEGTLSPDGRTIVFTSLRNGDLDIYTMRTNGTHLRRLTHALGYDGGPFFSPDGEWIAFFANGKLKKAALSGGGATVLADAENPRGGTWLEDGTIVFAPRVETPLFRVPAAGGTPVAITKLDAAANEHTHRWPDGLPGARGLLYTVSTRTGNYDEARLVVEGPGGTPRRVLVNGATQGRYFSSGHIVYLHDRTLFAVPFDLDRLALAGTAVPVIQGVASANVNGGAQDILQLYTRPAWRFNPYSTPVKGLYICSSSTPPGGGVHGMCGYYAAQAVLRRN